MSQNLKKQTLRKSRNSNIELLRILAMLGVVFLHYANTDIGQGFKFVQDNSINQIILYLLENLSICAVNLYVLISGFFLSNTQKRSFIKVLELIAQVIIIKIAFYLLTITLGNHIFSFTEMISCFVPNNYYVILYSTLYIISPYINVLINNLTPKYFNSFLIVTLVLFSIYTILIDVTSNITGSSLLGMSTVGPYGSQGGYTIVNFVIMYIVGAYIKKNDISIKTNKLVLLLSVNVTLLFFWSYGEHICGLDKTTAWNYNNPLVISLAVIIFLIFYNINIQSKIINELAKGSFTCFLIHTYFFRYANIQKAVLDKWYIMIINIIITLCGIYLLSFIFYKVYNFCTSWFFKYISNTVNRVKIGIN